jgi:CheY-like chemotaxis protein
MLKILLESFGYNVFAVASGKDALSVAANNQVDLILTDFDLPDMTGPTVVRKLRQLGNGSGRIPVVMLTALDGYEYRKLAVEAGCDAFLIKPPDFDILTKILDRLLAERGITKNRVAPAIPETAAHSLT